MWLGQDAYLALAEAKAKLEGKVEFLELESERLYAEIRRLTGLLSDLVVRRAGAETKPLSDPFEEDPKLPTVWLSDEGINPEELRQKITE